MRASISRPAQTDRSLKYDYCMVFKLEGNEQSDESKFIIQKMKSKGLDVFCYLSVQKDEMIALITAPVRCSLIRSCFFVIESIDNLESCCFVQQAQKLRAFADAIDFKMELDPHKVKHYLEQGVKNEAGDAYIIKPVYINEDPKYSPYSPFDHSKFNCLVSLRVGCFIIHVLCGVCTQSSRSSVRNCRPICIVFTRTMIIALGCSTSTIV